ncbi:MAG: acrylyl-CoA reductase AcuI [Syntrophus sp. SKADARSKE-3]|nr:acrylyl-CoA reductase AcuI [Syntrophus sp. SKADARSKE-3]
MATDNTFKTFVIRQEGGKTTQGIERLTIDDLPEGDVLVAVDYSSLNYKDGMAIAGVGKIVRSFPMVPGIDLAGTVLESASPLYQPGDKVVLTGWSIGERFWGGYTQKARVNSKWLVPLAKGMDTKKAMIIGTAGFTAMLCIMTIEEAGVLPGSGTVLVTGAAGGVGSVAIAILAKLGYKVAALTAQGQEHTHDYLHSLGAAEIVSGPEWNETPLPLETQRWSGAVDTVGSKVLARVLAEINYGGCVANCGLAGGTDLPTTVMPFILRSVSLRGVDSVMCPIPRRKQAWNRLVNDLTEEALTLINPKTLSLNNLEAAAKDIVSGKVRGRLIVDVNA